MPPCPSSSLELLGPFLSPGVGHRTTTHCSARSSSPCSSASNRGVRRRFRPSPRCSHHHPPRWCSPSARHARSPTIARAASHRRFASPTPLRCSPHLAFVLWSPPKCRSFVTTGLPQAISALSVRCRHYAPRPLGEDPPRCPSSSSRVATARSHLSLSHCVPVSAVVRPAFRLTCGVDMSAVQLSFLFQAGALHMFYSCKLITIIHKPLYNNIKLRMTISWSCEL